MFEGFIGVLALGVLAVMVFQVVRSGSQGPAAINSASGAVKGFYGTLMGN